MSILESRETLLEPARPLPAARMALARRLQEATGTSLGIYDVASAQLLQPLTEAPACDWARFSELFAAVAQRHAPEFVEEAGPIALLAVPLGGFGESDLVAIGLFTLRNVLPEEEFTTAGAVFGASGPALAAWARRQIAWQANALLQLVQSVLRESAAEQRLQAVEAEAESLATHLASTYEEISLLHRLTQNLTLSRSEEELGRVALHWLTEVIPAEGFVLQILRTPAERPTPAHEAEPSSIVLTRGACPVDAPGLTRILRHLGAGVHRRPLLVNRTQSSRPDWPFADVRQMVAVALTEGDNLFGYLAAFNHPRDEDYGTVEASLMNSVATLLGIHCGNTELYRQEAALLAGIVRALTSAIDAKDQYTCGHSERVAQVAVLLARELDCDAKMQQQLYLAGLLHDIGKIGIDDQVLRKPEMLSAAEYEHIKGHPAIGHRILRDLSKLEHVLPVVLHHHESWDGSGYPDHLRGEQIPLAARIVSVADSFDAMGSDRPYRQALSDEKIDAIFRAGAGRQWDPGVIAAFFRIRSEVTAICMRLEQPMDEELAAVGE